MRNNALTLIPGPRSAFTGPIITGILSTTILENANKFLQIQHWPVEAADFTRGHITAPLGHEADTPLGVGGLEGVDVVHERGLGGDLKISDHAVSLRRAKKQK